MYRVYEITENEAGKITRWRWDGDCGYYDVFESSEELEQEEERLAQIEDEWKRNKETYIRQEKRREELAELKRTYIGSEVCMSEFLRFYIGAGWKFTDEEIQEFLEFAGETDIPVSEIRSI